MSRVCLAAGMLAVAAALLAAAAAPRSDAECTCAGYGHDGTDGSGTAFDDGFATFPNPGFSGTVSVSVRYRSGSCDCDTGAQSTRCSATATITIGGAGGPICIEHSGGPAYGCTPHAACPPRHQCCRAPDGTGSVRMTYDSSLDCGAWHRQTLVLATQRQPPACAATGVAELAFYWHCDGCGVQPLR